MQSYEENYKIDPNTNEKLPLSPNRGLNVFSRLNALAAAEMLIAGKTQKIITSGGSTGPAIDGKPSPTEGDLLADAIVKRLKTTGKTAPDGTGGIEYSIAGQHYSVQPNEEESFLRGFISVENEATDTIENFVLSINKFIDQADGSPARKISLLGIGFHTKDLVKGKANGRIQELAKYFQLEGQTLSAEDVLRTLVKHKKSHATVLNL